MKKLFENNNKTAMQFVPTIVSHINDGSTQIVSEFTCSEALYKKIKSVHAGSLQSLIRELVEDATWTSPAGIISEYRVLKIKEA